MHEYTLCTVEPILSPPKNVADGVSLTLIEAAHLGHSVVKTSIIADEVKKKAHMKICNESVRYSCANVRCQDRSLRRGRVRPAGPPPRRRGCAHLHVIDH